MAELINYPHAPFRFIVWGILVHAQFTSFSVSASAHRERKSDVNYCHNTAIHYKTIQAVIDTTAGKFCNIRPGRISISFELYVRIESQTAFCKFKSIGVFSSKGFRRQLTLILRNRNT